MAQWSGTNVNLPMDEIAEGVRGLRIGFVNVFAVTHASGSWTLIDAGVPFSASAIRNWAESHFDDPPLAIVLTHGHFDHVSGASDLAQRWDVPIYAHPLEAPYLTGRRSILRQTPALAVDSCQCCLRSIRAGRSIWATG